MLRLIKYLFISIAFLSCKDRAEIPQTKIIAPQPREITLIFGGDVMLHLPQVSGARDSLGGYDFSRSFNYIKEYWKSADAVVLNLETTLADSGFSGYPMFASPYVVAENLKESGVTHLVTANNHTCDKWGRGIDRTIDYLDSLDIAHTGSFKDSVDWQHNNPIYIKKNGFNIAILNYTYGTNGLSIPKGKVVPLIDTVQMAIDIEKARRGFATNMVVFLHWGEEYMRTPSKGQVELSSWLRGKGVDIIIGSHPHVVQRSECDSLGVIVYSLGNFISNQQKRYSNGGINVKLHIKADSSKMSYDLSYRSFYVYVSDESPRYFCVDESSADKVIKNSRQKELAKEFFADTKKIMNNIEAR